MVLSRLAAMLSLLSTYKPVGLLVVLFLTGVVWLPAPVTAQESGASLPDMMGDNFDGGALEIIFTTPLEVSFMASGVVLPVSPRLVVLERDMMGFPDDLVGTQALDTVGNPIPNTFVITDEPLPPTEVPTAPNDDFVFDGGMAVYTGTEPLRPGVVSQPFDVTYSYSRTTTGLIPAGGGGVAVRRIKIAENNKPFPQNRIYFNFNFFNDVPAGFNDVSRYTFGFERAYQGGRYSMDVRIPFAATLDAEQTIDAIGARDLEFGNAALIFKLLVAQSNAFALAAGSGLTIPTAASTEVMMGETNVLKVRNESLHVLPFVAAAWTPAASRFFGQTFVQFDLDATGDTVFGDVPNLLDFPVGRRQLPQIGVLNDASILFVDVAWGAWLVRDDVRNRPTGLAVVGELHYSSTVNDADTVSGNGIAISDLSPRTDILNLTLGGHLSTASGLEVSSGFVIPLRRGDDRPFDFEYQLQTDFKF